jgi:hypothetical protein
VAGGGGVLVGPIGQRPRARLRRSGGLAAANGPKGQLGHDAARTSWAAGTRAGCGAGWVRKEGRAESEERNRVGREKA